MFAKLRNRFLLVNMLIITAVMVAALAVIYTTIRSTLLRGNREKLDSMGSSSISFVGTDYTGRGYSKDGLDISHDSFILPSDYEISFSILIGEDGAILSLNSYIDMPDSVYERAAEVAFEEQPGDSTITLEGRRWLYAVNRYQLEEELTTGNMEPQLQQTLLSDAVFLDVTESYGTLSSLLTTCIIVGTGMLVVIYFISLYFANRSIRPIAASWEKQRQFISDASHELKTPLAIISANADVLLGNQGATIGDELKWIQNIKNDTRAMTKLVNDLLYLARSEEPAVQEAVAPVDFSALAKGVLLSMEAIIYERQLKLEQRIDKDITVVSNEDGLKRILVVLLDNAIKYTDACGKITVSLNKRKRQAVFALTNTGKGIPKDALPKLFDKFYRADPAHTRGEDSFGLGLSIAKSIADGFGATLAASSITGVSTTFTLTVPLQ